MYRIKVILNIYLTYIFYSVASPIFFYNESGWNNSDDNILNLIYSFFPRTFGPTTINSYSQAYPNYSKIRYRW